MSLIENALITGDVREDLTSRGFIRWRRTRDFAERIITAFDVRTPGPEVAAGALSGGNLQKFVIGREILQRPSVFVVNQPTWGVDAAAAAAIRQAILDLAESGAGVIAISQDLDELMDISDHFTTLNDGHMARIRPSAGLSVEEIGLMMGGAPEPGPGSGPASGPVSGTASGPASGPVSGPVSGPESSPEADPASSPASAPGAQAQP